MITCAINFSSSYFQSQLLKELSDSYGKGTSDETVHREIQEKRKWTLRLSTCCHNHLCKFLAIDLIIGIALLVFAALSIKFLYFQSKMTCYVVIVFGTLHLLLLTLIVVRNISMILRTLN